MQSLRARAIQDMTRLTSLSCCKLTTRGTKLLHFHCYSLIHFIYPTPKNVCTSTSSCTFWDDDMSVRTPVSTPTPVFLVKSANLLVVLPLYQQKKCLVNKHGPICHYYSKLLKERHKNFRLCFDCNILIHNCIFSFFQVKRHWSSHRFSKLSSLLLSQPLEYLM